MASKRFEKGSAEWNMFQDYWGLCQKYYIPEKSDEWWEEVIREAGDFCEKYKNADSILSRNLAMALTDTLEQKYKKRKENNQ